MSKTFRKSFEFVSRDVAHYFPGHMARGMQKMQERLKDVDLILEIHDSRMPLSGRNPQFKDSLMIRPHILLLNKTDLGDTNQRQTVNKILNEQGINNIVYSNFKTRAARIINERLIPAMHNVLRNAPRYHREGFDHYNMLVIGVPNVGKSSLINSWRTVCLGTEKRATNVGAVAGVTTSVLEKIRVSNNPKIYLYDTPGIMPWTITNMHVGMKLALCGSVRDHLLGEDTIVDYLLFWLNKHENFSYVLYYDLPDATDHIYDFLAHVAKKNNFVIKKRNPAGGYMYMPDFIRTAKLVLQDFRAGKLGKVNLDQDYIQAYEKEHGYMEIS